MIQRQQSVYLFLIVLLSCLLLGGSFLSFNDQAGSIIGISFDGVMKGSEGLEFELIEKLLPLPILIILIPLISLITIFLYKNRKLQMKLAFSGIVLGVVFLLMLGYYSYDIIDNYNASILPGVKMIFPVLILVFNILAYVGIRKDDRLVKSYDRLR